jgi:hypothetical protein
VDVVVDGGFDVNLDLNLVATFDASAHHPAKGRLTFLG